MYNPHGGMERSVWYKTKDTPPMTTQRRQAERQAAAESYTVPCMDDSELLSVKLPARGRGRQREERERRERGERERGEREGEREERDRGERERGRERREREGGETERERGEREDREWERER